MSIPVTCPTCNKSMQVRESMVGKRGKCPYCQGVIEIRSPEKVAPVVPPAVQAAIPQAAFPQTPAPATMPAWPAAASYAPMAIPTENPAMVAQEVLGGFRAAIEPVNLSISYRLAVLAATFVMALLPLIYLGIIALVCWAVVAVFRKRDLNVGDVLMLLPVIIMVIFMIKPLFARRASGGGRRALDRQVEPLLFAFVDRLCEVVDAPQPRDIVVDCDVNASAGFRRGLFSMLGEDLTLHIGLPLAAGMSLQQFAGVLAHEFGHFTQSSGMRATYVIRVISGWFQRVVYQRDVLDDLLIKACHIIDLRISWIFWVARLFVWLNRKLLWCIMMLGYLVCSFLLRQMEFDADRHEARVAGSHVFPTTSRALRLLGVAHRFALSDLYEYHKEGRLGDNLPLLTVANIPQLPKELVEAIDKSIAEDKTGRWDTHPCDRQRNENAAREQTWGVFYSVRPATVLFRDFVGLSRAVTMDYYREVFGRHFDPMQVHPIEDLLARQSQSMEAGKAFGRYFQGQLGFLRPLKLPDTVAAAPQDLRETIAQLKRARRKMLELLPAYRNAWQEFDKADTRQIEAQEAITLLRNRIGFAQDRYSAPMRDVGSAESVRLNAAQQQNRLSLCLDEFEDVAAERLWAALSLVFTPQVAAKLPHAAGWQNDINRLLPALKEIGHAQQPCMELRNSYLVLLTFLENFEGREKNQDYIEAILKQMKQVLNQIDTLRRMLWLVPYPLDHSQADATIGQYLLKDAPNSDKPGDIYEAAREVVNSIAGIYFRLTGRLAAVAEQVETLVGLPPLPEPPEPDKEPAAQPAPVQGPFTSQPPNPQQPAQPQPPGPFSQR